MKTSDRETKICRPKDQDYTERADSYVFLTWTYFYLSLWRSYELKIMSLIDKEDTILEKKMICLI